jgi:KUP system potassium uptake protein
LLQNADWFFLMAPDSLRAPLVVLATMATIIASQAVITGAYSLTQQAIALGLMPRLVIRQTSAAQIGQIYMPGVNWMLLWASSASSLPSVPAARWPRPMALP